MSNDRNPQGEALTIAYIAYGARGAIAEGLTIDPDKFGGEEEFIHQLVGQAAALDAEWDFRYGEQGVSPHGASFVFCYEVAEPFGAAFAKALAEDPSFDPKPLIQEIFAAADPEFPRLDIEAIREAVIEDALDGLASGEAYAVDVVRRGFTGIDKMSRTELVRHYREIFGDDELPNLDDDDGEKPESAAARPELKGEEAIASVEAGARAISLLADFDARFGDSVAEDLDINGADAVEWISEFAPRVRDALDSLESFGPPEQPID